MNDLPQRRGVKRKTQWILLGGACGLLILAWPKLGKLMGQILFALLLSAAATPIEKRLKKHMSPSLAAGAAVGLLALGIVGLIGLLAPHMIAQISLIVSESPRLLSRLQALWDAAASAEWAQKLNLQDNGPSQWMGAASAWIGESLPLLITKIGAGADALSRAFLSPVLAYYFVRDRETFSYQMSLWIPLKHRKRVLAALREMRREAGGYVRGQSLVALAVAALTGLGLWAVGIPEWLILGLLMGLCEFIPYIGPIIGGVPIALFSLPQGMNALIWGLGVTILVQQIEGYFLSPRLMAGATGLHPVSVLLLLSAGGLLFGLPGMVAAVPAFVCLRGAARVMYETRG